MWIADCSQASILKCRPSRWQRAPTGARSVCVFPRLQPMHPRLGPLPGQLDRYRFEPKLDGYRALLEISPGELVGLWSKRGNSLLAHYPAVHDVPPSLRRRSALLDGELVGFGDDGRPRFQRMQLGSNVVVFVFDVLGLGNHLVIAERYE